MTRHISPPQPAKVKVNLQQKQEQKLKVQIISFLPYFTAFYKM